ncbi:MAG: hypothetical protein QOK37_3545 [Thermoanaerobaculia bacterium]|nr:hypothetical protein [Thermoanaerobaculia bacterium]
MEIFGFELLNPNCRGDRDGVVISRRPECIPNTLQLNTIGSTALRLLLETLCAIQTIDNTSDAINIRGLFHISKKRLL